jgi:CRISP-associated protein Cas1
MQVYLNKKGCTLKVRDGHLIVRTMEEEAEQRIPMGKIQTLFINRATRLTSDLAFVAAELDIDVIFTDRNGQPVARLWSNRFGSIATIRKQQLAFSQSPACLNWVQETLGEKLEGQMALLLMFSGKDQRLEELITTACRKIDEQAARIRQVDGLTLTEVAGQLRAWEAHASKVYWACISSFLPPQYAFQGRSRQPASDMFNALLNYAYGILYSLVETALIKAGIDPFIGLFHRDEHNRPVLVYDVIERFRPWADYVVISLCRQQVIFVEFFDIEEGGFWLNEQGKRILIQAFHDYFEEITRFGNLDRSRSTHVELYAFALASKFKSFKSDPT